MHIDVGGYLLLLQKPKSNLYAKEMQIQCYKLELIESNSTALPLERWLFITQHYEAIQSNNVAHTHESTGYQDITSSRRISHAYSSILYQYNVIL